MSEQQCKGIEIEPGIYSGCDAHLTGATDCPVCGPERKRAAERHRGLVWRGSGCTFHMADCKCEECQKITRCDKCGNDVTKYPDGECQHGFLFY